MSKIKFSVDNCRAAKEILGQVDIARVAWGDNFSRGKDIGRCTWLWRILRPESYEDFFYKYIDYAEKHKELEIPYRGLTEDELIDLARRYKEMTESKVDVTYPLETYLNDAICHVIIETYDGMQRERDAMEFSSDCGYKAYYPGPDYDHNYGIDFMVESVETKKKYGIQVKPVSFFMSDKKDVHDDRVRMCRKREKAKKELGIDTLCVIYKGKFGEGGRWLTHKGKRCFSIDELMSYDKNNIQNTINVKRDYINGL